MPLRRPAIDAATWSALVELWEDSPERFEILAANVARGARPLFGSITVHFQEGKIYRVEKSESLR